MFIQNTTIDLTKKERQGSLITLALWFLVALLLGIILQVGSSVIFSFIEQRVGGFSAPVELAFSLVSSGVFIFSFIIVANLIEKRSLKSLGFHRFMNEGLYFKGWLIGAGLIVLVYGLNVMLGGVRSEWNHWRTLSAFLYVIGFAVQGLGEEVMCRGYLMNGISRYWGPRWGIVLNSLIFSLMHFFNPEVAVIPLFNIFLAGILFSVLFYYNDSIWFVGAVHSAWNFVLGPVLGVPVSGNVLPDTWLITYLPESKKLWHGGDFGFEGGLVVTFILIGAITITVLYAKNILKVKQTPLK